MNSELYKNYLTRHINKPLDDCTVIALTGSEVVSLLWSLNSRFQSYAQRIATLPYDDKFEAEADAAIVAYVFEGDAWGTVSAQAWRVLLERHQQAIMLFQLKADEPLIPIPQELPPPYHLGAVLLFAIHEMKLPFPLLNQEALAVSLGIAPIPIREQ